MNENIGNIINNILMWSTSEFISFGNNNPFEHHDNDLLEFIKKNNCIDFTQGEILIARFEGTDKSCYIFFEGNICNCIKLVLSVDAVFDDQKNANRHSIFAHKIILHLKDFDSEFLVLDNNVLTFKNSDTTNIYGFHKYYKKDIEMQKEIYVS